MKSVIKIPDKLFAEFKYLTYNQIVLLLYLCKNEDKIDDIKKRIYKTNTSRFNKDLTVIQKYEDYIKDIRELENPINSKELRKNRKLLPRYYKLKISTFELILNDKDITKSNLLIILSFIKLYQNTLQRRHEIKIKELLSFTFNTKHPRLYVNYLKETLDKMISWKYDDNSVFLKSYEIKGKKLYVELDKKG